MKNEEIEIRELLDVTGLIAFLARWKFVILGGGIVGLLLSWVYISLTPAVGFYRFVAPFDQALPSMTKDADVKQGLKRAFANYELSNHYALIFINKINELGKKSGKDYRLDLSSFFGIPSEPQQNNLSKNFTNYLVNMFSEEAPSLSTRLPSRFEYAIAGRSGDEYTISFNTENDDFAASIAAASISALTGIVSKYNARKLSEKESALNFVLTDLQSVDQLKREEINAVRTGYIVERTKIKRKIVAIANQFSPYGFMETSGDVMRSLETAVDILQVRDYVQLDNLLQKLNDMREQGKLSEMNYQKHLEGLSTAFAELFGKNEELIKAETESRSVRLNVEKRIDLHLTERDPSLFALPQIDWDSSNELSSINFEIKGKIPNSRKLFPITMLFSGLLLGLFVSLLLNISRRDAS